MHLSEGNKIAVTPIIDYIIVTATYLVMLYSASVCTFIETVQSVFKLSFDGT